MTGTSTYFSQLYLAYGISTAGDRLWSFAVIFLLEYLGGIRLVGINQLVEGVTSMLLSGYVGNWLDRHDRKTGALTVVAANNLSVAISAGLLALCMTIDFSSVLYTWLLIASILFSALSRCASDGEALAFTKDWIVVMAKRETKDCLSVRNATMRTIDQCAAVLASLIVGYLIVIFDHTTACFIFMAWNLITWIAEAYLLCLVYSSVEELGVRQQVSSDLNDRKNTVNFCQMWSYYWNQEILLAALGLALLYMTVLFIGGIAVSYGRSQGIAENVLGIFNAGSAVLGFTGAFFYAFFERRIGLKKTGLVGMMSLEIFLVVCLISVFLPGSPYGPSEYFSQLTFEVMPGSISVKFVVSGLVGFVSKRFYRSLTND
ncbi:hypothetical protein L596_019856 [Steinernema carpocapsae]|uniref:Solute carrier family 40 member n=1 Tax=Steinernema carpocapsae TaxID=34508 RepID=A0A4U5MRT8_STECR|nr:hypothetical protein L596_019856 [Steinernema carpocapsae]